MTHQSVLDEDWPATVERLGGTAALKESARKTKAFLRGREFEDAISMLRMILAYCLGDGGLRSTAAWAASIGLADPRFHEDKRRQHGIALPSAPERRLACLAGWTCACLRRSQGEPRPSDPHRRRHQCSESWGRRQDKKQAVAHS